MGSDIKITINGKSPKEAADELQAVVQQIKTAEAEGKVAEVRSLILSRVKAVIEKLPPFEGHLAAFEQAARIVNACEPARYLSGVGAYATE